MKDYVAGMRMLMGPLFDSPPPLLLLLLLPLLLLSAALGNTRS